MQYKYVGDGAGIIGLPHEISDEEAEQRGPEIVELLKAAIENGSYTPLSPSTATSPQMPEEHGTFRGNKSKKKE